MRMAAALMGVVIGLGSAQSPSAQSPSAESQDAQVQDAQAQDAESETRAGGEERSAALGARLDAYFAPLAASSDFSGTVRIEEDGRLLAERRYGYADWPSARPHEGGTLYAGASITKGVLAASMLALADEGVLALGDRVDRYLPALGDRPAITIEAVLRHRAGLPRDLPAGLDLDTQEGGLAAWLTSREDLLGEPGEEAYSNVGYALLAELVEAAAGEPFAEAARRRVLRPAGMTDSFVSDAPVEELPGGASPYTAGPAPSGVATPLPAGVALGASGLVTTARDLSRWGTALAGMRDGALFAGDDPLGSLERGVEDGLLYLSAQGTLPGYAAGVTVWPDTGVTVAYASNLFSHSVIGIEGVLRRLVQGEAPAPLPPRPADAPLSPVHRALAGDYAHPGFGRVRIGADETGRGMRIAMPDREPYWTFYLTPIAGGRLHWRAFDTLFEQGPKGGLTATARSLSEPEQLTLPPLPPLPSLPPPAPLPSE